MLAGPLCGRTLAELGAEVIKVEPPRPDVSRFSAPAADGLSGYHAQQNVGKRNICIDLNTPGGLEIALGLCDRADILIENFRAGTLPAFGLGYETLAARNPGLIYASITGYGQTGPWRGRMAYAPTVQAEAGMTAHSLRHFGEALVEPRTDSLSHADVYAGLEATIAILAALEERRRSGRGQHVDIAMAATLLALNERAHVDLNGQAPEPEPAILGATDTPFFRGPGGEALVFASSLVSSLTFPSYLRAMRRGDLADDPRFGNAAARRANYAALHAIVQQWVLTFPDLAAVDAQLDEAKIAVGEIRDMAALAETPWAEHWGAVRVTSDRRGGDLRLPGVPWRFSRSELPPLQPPAFRGEHGAAILAEQGRSADEILEFARSGALLAQRPNDLSPLKDEPS